MEFLKKIFGFLKSTLDKISDFLTSDKTKELIKTGILYASQYLATEEGAAKMDFVTNLVLTNATVNKIVDKTNLTDEQIKALVTKVVKEEAQKEYDKLKAAEEV